MLLTTRVKLVLTGEPEGALSGVKVSLYDRDIQTEDDLLGNGLTDDKGEILFAFDSERYTDAEDQPSWRIESLPDLYVVVFDSSGQAILSTRAEVQEEQTAQASGYPHRPGTGGRKRAFICFLTLKPDTQSYQELPSRIEDRAEHKG